MTETHYGLKVLHHRCMGGYPKVFFGYKKFCGKTIIQFFGIRILIGRYETHNQKNVVNKK